MSDPNRPNEKIPLVVGDCVRLHYRKGAMTPKKGQIIMMHDAFQKIKGPTSEWWVSAFNMPIAQGSFGLVMSDDTSGCKLPRGLSVSSKLIPVLIGKTMWAFQRSCLIKVVYDWSDK